MIFVFLLLKIMVRKKEDIYAKGKEVLAEAMSRVEKWRCDEVSSISNSSQVTAFHLVCLTEEKLRMAAITGYSTKQQHIIVHSQFRNDLFSLEWCLRSLPKLPDDTLTKPGQLRRRWSDKISDKCFNILAKNGTLFMF